MIMTGMRTKKGFTIVELITVIVVLSIIGLGVYSIVKTGADAWLFLITRKAIYQEGRLALDLMLREILQMEIMKAQRVYENPEMGQEGYSGPIILETTYYGGLLIGARQHIQFQKAHPYFGAWYEGTTERSFFSQSDLVDFYYDAENKTIVKYYPSGVYSWTQYPPAWTNFFYGAKFVIARDVTDLTFNYGDLTYDWQSEEYSMNWADTHSQPTPGMVWVKFTIRRSGQEATFSSAVAIRKKMNSIQLGYDHEGWWW